VEVHLDLVKLGVHMFDLGTNPTAIIVLNATPEHAVQAISLIPNVFVPVTDAAIRPIRPHFRPHMIDHTIEVIDFAVKPADRVWVLPAPLPPIVVKARAAIFVNRLLSALLFDAILGVVRPGLESETGDA
jgi:hypothetical protein